MNDPGQHRLWAIPGDGVLAREGNLVLLTSIDDGEFAESLLELLARTSASRGDGRAFADAIAAAIERHQSWGEFHVGPSIVAFGPAGAGLAFTVSGGGGVEISTSHGKHRLVAGHPSMVLRSVVAVPVQAVRGGLGGNGPGDRTDRFSRLDSGTVRAWGFSYAAPAGAPAAASPGGEPRQVPQAPAAPQAPAGFPGSGATGPEAATPPFQPSFQPEAPSRAEPAFQAEPPAAAGRFGDEPAPFAPPPAEPRYGQQAPAPPPFAPGPASQAPAGYGFAEPAPGEPAHAESEPDLYELGLEEPGVAEPAPALQTSMGPPARPVPEPPPAQHYPDAQAEESAEAPIVYGVHCRNGHFTDPEARSCVVCGTGVRRRSAVPESGPRPPLGVLILDDGATVTVDGDYVIGRDPARDESVSAGDARPLRVVDAESTVSRIHAEVHVDGWQVLLTDLGSANGTRVQQQGAKTEQLLEPDVPVPLQHGARIFVGESSLRYEPYERHERSGRLRRWSGPFPSG